MNLGTYGETSQEVDVAAVEAKLGVEFRDRSLLIQALTHRSYAVEARDERVSDNERLEFLGDAVLKLVACERLYLGYPSLPEGEMSKAVAQSVSTRTLSRAARRLGLGSHVRLGKGERAQGGGERESILADLFESIIGALYIDQGLDSARKFILSHLDGAIATAVRMRGRADEKTVLQEIIQGMTKKTPTYRVTQEAGPDHDKRFTVEVYSGDEFLGRGVGRSKKEAARQAAVQALDALEAACGVPREPAGGSGSEPAGTEE